MADAVKTLPGRLVNMTGFTIQQATVGRPCKSMPPVDRTGNAAETLAGYRCN